MAIFNPDSSAGSFLPPAQNDIADQRFSAFSVVAAFPVALIFGGVAVSALSAGQAVIGVVFAAITVGICLVGLRIPYVAIVGPDGSLNFKALTRTVTTHLSHVQRITRTSGGRGGSSWIFYFDGTRAQLNNRSGRMLAAYVVDHNPRVDYPASLQQHRY